MKTHWKILISLGILLLVIFGVSYVSMRVQSEGKLDAYKKTLREKGEKLEISEVLPPAVPAASNGVSLVQSAFALFDTAGDEWTNLPPTMSMVAPGRAMVGWALPNVRGYDFTNSWENVIAAARANRPATEMLIQAAAYPVLDFHLDYSQWPDSAKMLLGHLAPLKRSAQRLSAATICDLHNGNAASAVTNLCALLALVKGAQNERTLISQLVCIAMASIAAAVSWEYVQSTNTTDGDLAMLQRSWERLEFIEPVEKSLLMERAFMEVTIPKMRANAEELNRYAAMLGSSGTGGSGGWLDDLKDSWDRTKSAYAAFMWRASWSYSDELNALQGDQIILEAMRTMETNQVFNPAYSNMLSQLAAIGVTSEPDSWLLIELDIPDYRRILSSESAGFSASIRKTMVAEAFKRIAITAIALKRFQLKNGNFPEKLSELTPEFFASVPLDPVDGQPLRYHPNADGTYLLYSVGEDGVDDGGDPTNASGSSSLYWQNAHARDWVWPQPATEAEIQAYYAKQTGETR